MRLLGDRTSRRTAWKMALEHGFEIYDAEYLAVTKLQADALITIDPDLAAKARNLVPLAPLEALADGLDRPGKTGTRESLGKFFSNRVDPVAGRSTHG